MSKPGLSQRQLYIEWVEEQIEEFKASVTRDELMELADQAVREMFDTPEGQYPLTEILLRDAVDDLISRRLGLPSFRRWLRMCRSDTDDRPPESTPDPSEEGEEIA